MVESLSLEGVKVGDGVFKIAWDASLRLLDIEWACEADEGVFKQVFDCMVAEVRLARGLRVDSSAHEN